MVRAGLDYLAAADATAMAAPEQARCLRGLEQANSVATAARTSILGAFAAGQGPAADADYSPRAWLIHKTGVTKGAAVAYTAWIRRAEAHPLVAGRLAAGEIPESVARTLCLWTDKLGEDRREEAEEILADAAACGLGLAELAGLFAEIYERSRAGEPDRDKDGVVRGPGAAAGDHAGRRRGAARRPDSGVRRRGAGGAGRPVGARGRAGHPDAGAALPRRAGRGDAPAGGGGHAAAAGRAADQGLGAHPADRAPRNGRQHGPGQAVGHRDAGRVGGAPRGRLRGRREHRGLAGRRPRPGGRLRRGGSPGRHRPGQPGRAGGHGPAVRPARQAPPRRPGRRRRHDGGPAAAPAPRATSRRTRPGRRRRSSRPSSARPSTSCRVPAAWPASCAAASWARGWAAPACRWTSATPRPSRPASATRSSCAISAAGGPAAAASPPPRARSTTSGTRPTAARPAPKNASCCVPTTTRS